MNVKTLSEIDFFRIRDEAAGYCVTEEGRLSFVHREPFKDSKQIDFYKNAGREWTDYISCTNKSPVLSWEPIKPLFPIIKTSGACLSLEQLRALGQFCLSVKNVKECIKLHSEELKLNVLLSQVELLGDGTDAEKMIFRVIDKDGNLRDLPEIMAIRKQIQALNTKIKGIMHSYTSNQKLADILESTIPVLRGGRQVLAVKASQQNKIPGIIHEVSQSAQTVYIEPSEAVICSNELIQKENELQQVIKKILYELTAELQPVLPFFTESLPVMLFFDTTLAAAKWGIKNKCVYALPCNNLGDEIEPPLLLGARHPLLGDSAVPIDIRFMSGKRVLIITGPNTGGKTVSLKTFALFSMLNQTGIPIPAKEGTRLPVFGNIFADIGDSQSLDMSLSTFSGHMKNISHAVNNADSRSLVLLDELGSGTDPLEGTAISMAVLDTLIEKKAFVLITTHHGILKNYGYTNPCCINASVEFNQDTLTPSYKLIMGIPGESHALEIAQRSGLPGVICKKARDYIATEQADVSALIRGLNEKHLELDELRDSMDKKSRELDEKILKQKERDLELKRREHDLKNEKQQEMHDFLVHSRRQLENLVRTLKEGEITREKTLGVKQFISELEKNVDRMDAKIEKEEELINKKQEEYLAEKEAQKKKYSPSNKKTKKKMSNAEALKYAVSYASPVVESAVAAEKKPLKFEPGACVVAGQNQNEGILLKLERKGVWTVQFGSVKMTVKEKDLKLVAKDTASELKPSFSLDLSEQTINGETVTVKEIERPVYELRLLGLRAEEAIKQVEHQIDLCVLNNFLHFSIIHGKGDGILQQAVRDYLSHCPVVKDFSFAPAEDGGAGKTYVELK